MDLTFPGSDEPIAYSVAADLQLWHERLGHTNVAAIKLIYRTGSIDDFEIDDSNQHDEECKCPTCAMTKATFTHMPNRPREFDPDGGRALKDIVSDVKVIGTDSMNGSRYFVTFICKWSRHCVVYFLSKKSEVSKAWADYLAWAKRNGYIVETITTDRGGEYWSRQSENGDPLLNEESLAEFEQVCKYNLTGNVVEHLKTPGQGHSDMNPIAERYNRKIMDIASAQLYHAKLGVGFWEWSVRHAVYLINRIPLKFHARYHGSKPAHSLVMRVARVSYSRIRTWGCDMYERVPNGPMSSEPGFPNARKLIYLGVSDDGMSFLGYDVEASNVTNELRFCMNVQFDESMTNRTNNLRAYDERRKLQPDCRPQTYNEWDSSITEGHDHVRALYDTYDTDQQFPTERLSSAGDPITSAGDGTTGEQPSSAGGNGSTNLESKGRDEAERVQIPTDLSASPSTTVESDSGSDGTDSEDEPYEPSDDDVDYTSDISEDDYEAPKTRSERSALRRARRSKTDSQMPTSFQRSLSQARVHGPLTEQKLQQARDRE